MAFDFDHNMPNKLRSFMWVFILAIIVGVIAVAIVL